MSVDGDEWRTTEAKGARLLFRDPGPFSGCSAEDDRGDGGAEMTTTMMMMTIMSNL